MAALMKSLVTMPIIQKAADALAKEFQRATNRHMNEFLKAADVGISAEKKEFPTTFRKPFIMQLAACFNAFL